MDLIVCAQSAHWFDMDSVYSEMQRVLKPGGSVGIWGYRLPIFSCEQANEIFNHYHFHTLGPYWDSKRKLLDAKYVHISYPFSDTIRQDLLFSQKLPFAAFMGYVSTSSALKTWRDQVQQGKVRSDVDILHDLEKKLKHALTIQQDEQVIEIQWPIHLLLGKKCIH